MRLTWVVAVTWTEAPFCRSVAPPSSARDLHQAVTGKGVAVARIKELLGSETIHGVLVRRQMARAGK